MVFILVNNLYSNKGMDKQRIITLLIAMSTPIRTRSQGSSYSAFKSITSKNEFPRWIVIGGNRKTSCSVHICGQVHFLHNVTIGCRERSN